MHDTHENASPSSRASSPSKRRASAMEDGSGPQSVDAMDIDCKSPACSGTGKDVAVGGTQEKSEGAEPQEYPETAPNTASASTEPSCQTTPISMQTSSGTGPGDVSSASTEMDADDPIPSIDEQVKCVHARVLQSNSENAEERKGFVIAQSWLSRVIARSKYAEEMGPFEKSALEGEIGPVDNTSVLSTDPCDDSLKDELNRPFIPLKPGMAMDRDLEIVPEDVWDDIVGWYGLCPGQKPIIRYMHDTTEGESDLPNFQYELYPPIFTIRIVQNAADDITKASERLSQHAPKIVASRSTRYMDFLSKAKDLAAIPNGVKVNVWRILGQSVPESAMKSVAPVSMLSPPGSREASPSPQQQFKLLFDRQTFQNMDETQKERITVQDQTMDHKYNGHSTVGMLGLAEDQVLVLVEARSKQGADGNGDATKRDTKNKGIAIKKEAAQSRASSGRTSPASGPVTRGRNRTLGRTRGTVGLINLGNTCYMNSALQCIRACEELTLYFLAQQFKKELNPSNPLGHRGQVAQAYASLLDNIYRENQLSIPPRHFKQVLGKYGTMFSGYGQQDSQEFMSFLVDGLHEDLNRVYKKPYTENPESDDNTVNDPEAIKALGEKFRENHRARNNSVVMDLFNGFYKNKLVCPECSKVSITFDPFSLLTLQLPLENTWEHTFTWIPAIGRPFKIEVELEKNTASINTLKNFAAARIPGTSPEKMVVAEIFAHKIYRFLHDETIMEAQIQSRDDMVIYELDSRPVSPPKKKLRRSMLDIGPHDDEDEHELSPDDRIVVTILHRAPGQMTYSTGKQPVLWPSLITLSKDEAQDYDEILRRVLGKVAGMTTKDIFADLESATTSDMDATRCTDESKSTTNEAVQARSVDSEDGLVDITMTNAPALEPVLQKGAPIPQPLQTLFELSYLPSSSNDPVAHGWQTFDNNKVYSTLQSRMPKPKRPESVQSSSSQEPSPSSTSSDVDDPPESRSSTMMSYSVNDSDNEISSMTFNSKPGSARNKRGGKGRRDRRGQATYTKKNNSKFGTQTSRIPETPPENDDNPMLIRQGEAIIVDWEWEAFDALFNGRDDSELRGQDARTAKLMDTLPDEELQKRREARTVRKRYGFSLEDCFAETAKSEILTEENAWYCNRCKELRLASKQLEIWTVPDILVIHLKRFAAHRQFRDKIEVLVDFPVEGLDLNGIVGINEGKDLTYDLFAVDNHYGGLGGGHYTAYAKNFFDGKWYDFNDSSVHETSNVVTSAAYLLFYRRRSSTPLGTPELQKLVDRYHNRGMDDSDSSRTASPSSVERSGNDQRPGDSSPNGSPSGLGAHAANHPGNWVGSGDDHEAETVLHDELPDYDEAVDLGADGLTGQFDHQIFTASETGMIIGPLLPSMENDDRDDDMNSNVASDGDEEDRNVDDDMPSAIHHSTPEMGQETHVSQFHSSGDNGGEEVRTVVAGMGAAGGSQSSDGPVMEVRVDEDD